MTAQGTGAHRSYTENINKQTKNGAWSASDATYCFRSRFPDFGVGGGIVGFGRISCIAALGRSDFDIQNNIHRSAVWEMPYVGVESMPIRKSALSHQANVKTVQWLSDGSQAISNMAHNVKSVGEWLSNPEFNLEGKVNVGKMYRRRHSGNSQFIQEGHTRI